MGCKRISKLNKQVHFLRLDGRAVTVKNNVTPCLNKVIKLTEQLFRQTSDLIY